MKYVPLGSTGTLVSRLCLGGANFGGAGEPPYDVLGGLGPDVVAGLVDAALDTGVNFIDTANTYAFGESEELLGKLLKGRRRDLVIASKVQNRVGPGPNHVGQSRVHVLNALEDSLRRLDTDYIDLYQVHSFDPLTTFDEVLGVLDDVVRQGKVRYIGRSNLAAWQVMKALGVSARRGLASFASVQAYYSLAGRDLDHELVPMIKDQGLALTVWSP
ncbi:MAG TPA: aldo/keto reductase, partial [Acidimicrobiales bacterium]|nr:aldo/keto reductase [Acidimicrobiales bacterium]